MKTITLSCLFALAAVAQAGAFAAGASCMVLGSRDAKVSTAEGEKSPVFMTKDCAALRLVSGKAQASWVGQDGKPKLIPITASGVSALPAPGAEERSVNVVWSELTTRRERQQAAYMRSVGFERAQKIYVPANGLLLVERSELDAELTIQKVAESATVPLLTQAVKKGEAIHVPRAALELDQTYVFTIRRGDTTETWRWKTAAANETAALDEQLSAVQSTGLEPDQRLLVQAMLYDQLKLKGNMELTMQALKSLDDAKANKP